MAAFVGGRAKLLAVCRPMEVRGGAVVMADAVMAARRTSCEGGRRRRKVNVVGGVMLLAAGACLHPRQAASRVMEKGMSPGKLCHRRQGGDGHGAEAITMRSFMSELSASCVIDDNMKASHR